MKKIIIKVPRDELTIIKETPEQRKERLKYSYSMTSRVIPNKKRKTRAQLKQEKYDE